MSAQVEIIRSLSRLEEIRPAWSHLLSASESATPFHTPEWLLTWWRHFGSGNLLAVLLWDDDALAGIVPCFTHSWEGREQLTIIGSGISDYLEPCVPPTLAGVITSALLKEGGWQRAVWQDLAATSPFADPTLWPNAAVTTQPDMPCSAIPIAGSFDAYWNARSKDLRRNLRRYGDRARLTAPIEFHHSCGEQREVIDSLISLHGLRWQRRGEAGTIEDNRAADFIRAVAHEMAASGLLRLFWVNWGEELVAVSLGFEWKRQIFSYLSAFDPRYEPLGFGRVLLHESLKLVWQEGLLSWNFLRGDESYKESWGALRTEKLRLIVER